MERWGFLFSAVSSPIVYFLTTTRAVCPNINPIMLCAYVCDVNYAVCYWGAFDINRMADNHNTQLTVMSIRPKLDGIVPILLENPEYANPDSTPPGQEYLNCVH